jgi:trigger factor
LKWEEGAPVTFEFHVELKPELQLQRLGNFRLTRKVAAITAAQVDAQLNAMREQRAPWTPVAGEKPKPKDLVDVIIATRENGEVKDPQPYQFVLGEGRAIPDVEERIMGLLPGESVDATVRFPDDFAEEAKRGQTRDIQLTLREVKRQELPALDDAFAREMGDFESLGALRAAVSADLGKEAEREADAKVRAELVEQIVQANNVVAPRPLVERVLGMYAQAYEVPEERWEKFAQEFRGIAESQVRRDLVLDYVVESQNLRATEAELDERIQQLAERRGMKAAELYASLEKAKRLRDVARSITEEKVFTHLLSQSTVEQA